jgi:hypothetical protein
MTRLEAAAYAARLRRSEATVWRWARAGCDFDDPESIKAFLIEAERKKTNVQRYRDRRSKQPKESTQTVRRRTPNSVEPPGNAELPPAGKKGAAAALERLEIAEERAHARLEVALTRCDPVQVQACQDFWLKCSETLRRLDLAVELARRDAEEQVPKKLACDVALYISDSLRISFMIFLSSESRTLMGIKDTGQWKAHAISAFKSILHLTVRNSLKTNSPIPDWAAEKVKESWNVPEREEPQEAPAASGTTGP